MTVVKYDDLNPGHDLMKRADLWGEEGQECLNDTEIDDCIEYVINNLVDDLDVTIEVKAFAKMKVSVDYDNDILSPIIQGLDEEYGDPEGSYSESTSEMVVAAKNLAKVIEVQYEPWACIEIGTVEVDVLSWVKEHRSDWLEEKTQPEGMIDV